ncbi:MAG: hypothetical protein V3V95_09190 [Thermodesulfobacteriota bacterium]
MKKKHIAILAFLFVVFCAALILQQSEAEVFDKRAIHEVMKDYIEEKTARGDGVYYIKREKTEFQAIHTDVVRRGRLYISCSEFVSGTDLYDVDFYIGTEYGKYMVVREVLHKKNGRKINELLWKAP